MRIKDWLFRLLGGRVAPRAQAGRGPAATGAVPHGARQSLNLRNAIEAHQEWKAQLETAIRSRSVLALDARVVQRDDECPLGQWIHGPGTRLFGGEPRFEDLKAKHASFHRCAARTLLLAQSGQHDLALAELSSNSEFAALSWEVIGDLASMFTQLEGAVA